MSILSKMMVWGRTGSTCLLLLSSDRKFAAVAQDGQTDSVTNSHMVLEFLSLMNPFCRRKTPFLYSDDDL